MKYSVCIVVLGAAALVGGCSRDYNIDPIFDFQGKSEGPKPYQPDGPWDEFRLKINPYTYEPAHTGETLYAIASGAVKGKSEESRKEARNALMEAMILASDHNAGIHMAAIKATNSTLNVGLGTAALGLTAGATLAVEATSKALAASSTAVQGTRSLINEEVYAQSFAESIITLMEAERTRRAAMIRSHYNDSLIEFPVERGLAEVMSYHQTGSMYFGLSLAREAIQRETVRRRDDGPGSAGSQEQKVKIAKEKLEDAKVRLARLVYEQSSITDDVLSELNDKENRLKQALDDLEKISPKPGTEEEHRQKVKIAKAEYEAAKSKHEETKKRRDDLPKEIEAATAKQNARFEDLKNLLKEIEESAKPPARK